MKRILYFVAISEFSFVIAICSLSMSWAHMILRAEGEVQLEKAGSSAYITGAGEILDNNDILTPLQRATVMILCNHEDNVMIRRAPRGVPSKVITLCPQKRRRIVRSAEMQYLPGGNRMDIPYTITPRLTFMLASQPILRWNAVRGTNVYTVRVIDNHSEIIWQKETKLTQVVYPLNAPDLKWGIAYMIAVRTDAGASSLEDAGSCRGFKRLAPYKAEKIQNKKSQIENSNQLEPDEHALAKAYLYSTENLLAEAIETLEVLAANNSRNPLIYQKLAVFYAIIGLNMLAETNGSKALRLYSDAGNTYGLATTQAEIAGVKIMLGKTEEAARFADEAKSGYRKLGDARGVNLVDQRMLEAQRLAAPSGEKQTEPECASIITPDK